MKVLFLQSAHYNDDDRVCHHQAPTLRQAGMEVEICGREDFEHFHTSDADVIIADTPRALWRARHSRAKLVYDITEWYPARQTLKAYHGLHRYARALAMSMANVGAGLCADAFIFGEHYKAIPFRILFPWKRHIYLPYYPDLQYIKPTAPTALGDTIHLLYTGPLNREKGWTTLLETLALVRKQLSHIHFCIDVITRDVPQDIKMEGFTITYFAFLPFNTFCQHLPQYDIFLDLRQNDLQSSLCLPIKLFYYMACGRPVIYSHMKGIEYGVHEINEFGVLVDDTEEAALALCQYIQNPSLYLSHCQKAIQWSHKQYNWANIQERLIKLIHNSIAHP